MSEDPTSRPDPMLFAEDFLASPSARRESNKLKTTPDISGRRCLGLSGNAGPLGLLEKMLLDSSDWAWTKYSLTWKAKATPQGRLIFQLARSELRTSGSGYGLLHTPTAKANQMSPSMATRDKGSWGSTLWPTPTTQEIEHPNAKLTETGRRLTKDKQNSHSLNLADSVRMWPTPSAQEPGWKNIEVVDKDGNHPTHHNQRFYDKTTGRVVQKGLQQVVKMWPTPTGMTGGEGVAPSHLDGSHGWSIGAAVNAIDSKIGGKLNPQWVAWLMGYPIEYLNSVPWETASSRRSRKKSDKQ